MNFPFVLKNPKGFLICKEPLNLTWHFPSNGANLFRLDRRPFEKFQSKERVLNFRLSQGRKEGIKSTACLEWQISDSENTYRTLWRWERSL